MANTGEPSRWITKRMPEMDEARAHDDNVHRLPPRVLDGRDPQAPGDEGDAIAKRLLAEDRAPEAKARDAVSTVLLQIRVSTGIAKKASWKRPLMFALLPVALVIGAYFYVTGGAVMSTDNAYVQADVVGVSNDISGIVVEVWFTTTRRSRRATCCSSSTISNSSWRWTARTRSSA